jgi:hypothetical protein
VGRIDDHIREVLARKHADTELDHLRIQAGAAPRHLGLRNVGVRIDQLLLERLGRGRDPFSDSGERQLGKQFEQSQPVANHRGLCPQ